MISSYYIDPARQFEYSSLVLLLLFLRSVPRFLSPQFLIVAVSFIGYLGADPADAGQRTFVLAPADLVAAPDLFGAKPSRDRRRSDVPLA